MNKVDRCLAWYCWGGFLSFEVHGSESEIHFHSFRTDFLPVIEILFSLE